MKAAPTIERGQEHSPPSPQEAPSGAPVSTPEPAANPTPAQNTRRRKGRWRLLIVLLPLVVLGAVLYYWFFMRPYESTDDAFIEGDVIPIAPQVPGQIVRLRVGDNQHVKPGDLLVEIDPRDFEARLAQARAGLASAQTRLDQARAQVASDQAKVEQERANLIAVQSEAERAQADYRRYESLPGPAVSSSQLDLAATQARSATANVELARSRATAAEAQVALSQAGVQTAAAEVKRNEATVRQAEIDLSYTKVPAPGEGTVTHRTVESGAYVQTGQALLALVPTRVWVLANFKETQLRHMRPGQPVAIGVDAYPDHKFRGHVDSIQRGSGARFSLLPPENATGNYVKVVQRVPVKILFDDPPDPALPLGPGMSVVPRVRVLAQGRPTHERR